MILGSARS